MPLHDYRCPVGGHIFEAVARWDERTVQCPQHFCHGERVYLTMPMGFVQKDICYDSPVDGRPVTTRQGRIEDLRRNDCIPFEPGMKQDAERKRAESDAAIDKSVDATVDEFFATAGTRKLEKLEQELRAGASAEVTRASPATT